MPSLDELDEMFVNKDIINATSVANGVSAFTNHFYWSSTKNDTTIVNLVNLSSGAHATATKTDAFGAWAVREFYLGYRYNILDTSDNLYWRCF